MTLRRSSVINNYMGIDNDGTLTVINSTISGNGMSSPVMAGGGIENTNSEAYWQGSPSSTVPLQTIKRNSGGAGIYNASTRGRSGHLAEQYRSRQPFSNRPLGRLWGRWRGKFAFTLGYNIIGSIGVYNGVVYNCKGNWVNTDLVGIHNSPAHPRLNTLADVGNNIWMHKLSENNNRLWTGS